MSDIATTPYNARESLWARINRDIDACSKCPLYKTVKNKVKYGGTVHAQLVFVGEAPGYYEDMQGRPFVGPAGKVLNELVRRLNLDKYCILNVVKCRPPDNKISDEYIRACDHFLFEQILTIMPRLVVTLGAVATSTMLRRDVFITDIAGRPQNRPEYVVYPMLHPAAVLRSSDYKERWYNDTAGLQALTLKMGFRKSLQII